MNDLQIKFLAKNDSKSAPYTVEVLIKKQTNVYSL